MPKSRSRSKFSWKQEYGGMPAWGIAGALGLIGVLFAVPAVVNATAEPATPYVRPTDAFDPPAEAETSQRIVVVGDSNTAVNSPDLAAGDIGDASWVSVLLSDGFTFAGGWAQGGTPSATQAEGLAPVSDADVLLVMTGTNDLGQGVPFDQTTANIDAIAAKAPAGRVVLLAIPPRDVETSPSSVEFNASLQALAAERGWEFFDGLGFLRAPDGGFVAGTSNDGVHLTREAQMTYGQTISDYLG